MVINKAFFRYIRGELLNGFYIRKLNLVANGLASLASLKEELLYWQDMSFTTQDLDCPIRHGDLKGIAQVAGILSIRGATGFLPGWFRLSETFMVGDHNRSERGLLRQDSTGALEYVRTLQDEYSTDIATIATDGLRMSLIPEGAEPVGYVWGEDTAAILETGLINEDVLHDTPPAGYVLDPVTGKWYWPFDYQTTPPIIYAAWYGDKFLPLADSYPLIITLPDVLFESLILLQQKIKYNGLGLIYLLDITNALVSDLIGNLKIELLDAYEGMGSHIWYYKMTFDRNEENFGEEDGWGRFSAWKYFVESKYPYIQFNEAGI